MKSVSKLLLALVFAGLLAGCHTMQGAGQDIQAGGQAVSNAAS